MPTDEPADLHRAAADMLRTQGHRYTSARRRLVEALRTAGGPLSMPQLIEFDDQLAQSSTYRNLTILEEAGVATRIVTSDDHARFELDETLTRRHHHHLICTVCGDVTDFELPGAIEGTLDRELDRAGRAAMFQIDSHRLDLLGTCARCA